jgi:signal transduction histidine kinase
MHKAMVTPNKFRSILQQERISRALSIIIPSIFAVAVIAGLYWSSIYSYLLFHSLAEIFSIVIAATIFLIAWNTRQYIQSHYFLFIGIAYLFIAGLDLIHTLAFPGMQIFSYEFYANQFWIAARFMESLSFLIAFNFINKHKRIDVNLIFMIYTLLFILVVLSIFWWDIFPACYIIGVGQTPFKIISEYIIVLILLICLYLLYRNKDYFDKKIYNLLFASFCLTVLSEFSFTMYVNNYDMANFIGHILKIFSFYLIYKAIIETGFSKPISFFFKELKQSEEALKGLNATKDKFFSIIAHDLKSPFNSLIGFSELLMNKYDVFNEEERRQLFVMINNSSKKAHTLLDNLLQWSSTQTGALETKPELFDIVELINDNIGLLEGSTREKKIKLKYLKTSMVMVYADKNMISAVLRNFVNNAIKFTPQGGAITIKINSKGEKVEISVADTGVGMTNDLLKNLFIIDKYKSTPGTANEKGSGLGLLICKEFVEKNHGSITVTSELQKGSTFTFTLPKGNENNEK